MESVRSPENILCYTFRTPIKNNNFPQICVNLITSSFDVTKPTRGPPSFRTDVLQYENKNVTARCEPDGNKNSTAQIPASHDCNHWLTDRGLISQTSAHPEALLLRLIFWNRRPHAVWSIETLIPHMHSNRKNILNVYLCVTSQNRHGSNQ